MGHLPEQWDIEDVAVGDYLAVEMVSADPNSEFHKGRIWGFVVEVTPGHKQAKLGSGWCAHTHDRILKHIPAAEASVAVCAGCGKPTEYDRIGQSCFRCYCDRRAMQRAARCQLQSQKPCAPPGAAG